MNIKDKKEICKHHFVEVREDYEKLDCDGQTEIMVKIIIYCENCGKISLNEKL